VSQREGKDLIHHSRCRTADSQVQEYPKSSQDSSRIAIVRTRTRAQHFFLLSLQLSKFHFLRLGLANERSDPKIFTFLRGRKKIKRIIFYNMEIM
jgi:hypothetical protein